MTFWENFWDLIWWFLWAVVFIGAAQLLLRAATRKLVVQGG